MPGTRHIAGGDLSSIAALALFYFVFLGFEYFFDMTMGTMVDPATVVLYQGLILGASVVGFLLFPLLDSRLGYQHVACALVSALVLVVCIVVTGLALGVGVTLAAGCVGFAALGLAGGSAHWTFSKRLATSQYLARLVAMAYACGLLLQFLTNTFATAPMAEMAVLCVGTVALFSCLLAANGGRMARLRAALSTPLARLDKLGYRAGLPMDDLGNKPVISDSLTATAARAAHPSRLAACLIVTVILMAGLFGTLDNIITLANANGRVDVAAWPRLFLLGGALVAGALYDLRGRRYMPLIMFCMAMLSTIAIVAMEGGGSMLAGTLVFYISSGFFVVFFTTSFFAIAPRMRYSRLWASMGRIANNITAIAIAAPSLMLVSTNNTTAIIAVDLVLFAGIAVALYLSGSFNANNAEFAFGQQGVEGKQVPLGEANGLAAAANFDRRLQTLADECSLTPRELDVLRAVVSGEQPIKQIASDMGISPRMVQRHLTSLYQKTGTQTRAGLTSRFYGA